MRTVSYVCKTKGRVDTCIDLKKKFADVTESIRRTLYISVYCNVCLNIRYVLSLGVLKEI